MKKPIEIVAPAGSEESLNAALNSGADSIYLGTQALNARRNAQNFDALQLKEAVRRCHERGVRVLLTVNTLLYDEEFPLLRDTLWNACEAGVDALILQDLGAVSLVKQMAPGMRLHASTQMGIHSLEGAKALEGLGFSRVVLARELTKEEIAFIAQNTSLELEVFVHGALCMCVSGQCYLSSMIGGRSGNRGLCAQPCRLPAAMADGERDVYALSLKDLSLVEKIDELRQIGVSSIKIEGRMKRPEYVAAAVTACRNALEGNPVDMNTLRSVFSRSGFTDGYFTGKRDRQMFGVRQKEDVVAAEGVLKDLRVLYKDEFPRFGVEFTFTMEQDCPAVLTARDEDGYTAAVQGPAPELAQNRPTDYGMVEKSLKKTGGTPYYMKRLDCQLGEGLILPISAVNAMRREALEQLASQRLDKPACQFIDEPPVQLPARKIPQSQGLRIRLKRAEQLTPWLAGQAEFIILEPEELIPLVQESRLPAKKAMAELPRLCFDPGELQQLLERCRKAGITHVLAGGLGAVCAAKEAGFTVHGSYALNVVNSYSAESYRQIGLSDTQISFELNLKRAGELKGSLPLGALVYGALPLMVFRNCPLRARGGCQGCAEGIRPMIDRMGNHIFLECTHKKYSELLNPKVLYLGDKKGAVQGFQFVTLYFTREDSRRCEQVVKSYLAGLPIEGDKTNGLYYREVL